MTVRRLEDSAGTRLANAPQRAAFGSASLRYCVSLAPSLWRAQTGAGIRRVCGTCFALFAERSPEASV